MKALLTLGSLGLLGLASADTFETLHMPIRRQAQGAQAPGVVDCHLDFNNRLIPGAGAYFIDLDIGTPPQRVEVLLDTGSSNLWVPKVSAPQCQRFECPGGSFNASRSSTFRDRDETVRLQYFDGGNVNDNYGFDTVVSGNVSLPNFKFAVSEKFTLTFGKKHGSFGMLGIGTRAVEADAEIGYQMPTFNDALVAAGYIGSNSYSLFLDHKDSPSGSILFGGVDTSKFTGPLSELKAVKDEEGDQFNGHYTHQRVAFTKMTSVINKTSQQYTVGDLKVSAILDSGTSGIFLPDIWLKNLLKDLPILWGLSSRLKRGSLAFCDDSKADIALVFALGDAEEHDTQIRVPFHELMQPVYWDPYNRTKPIMEDSRPVCSVALVQGPQIVLGTPFLRSAYTFYNLDKHTISMAPAAYNASSTSAGTERKSLPSVVAIWARSVARDKRTLGYCIVSLSLWCLFGLLFRRTVFLIPTTHDK